MDYPHRLNLTIGKINSWLELLEGRGVTGFSELALRRDLKF